MKKNIVLGIEFEQSRPKLKKDKKFFEKLEYREEPIQSQPNKTNDNQFDQNEDETQVSLPIGLK